MAKQTTWAVPATTSGNTATRNFHAFNQPFPYRRELEFDNQSTTATLTIKVNGRDEVIIGPDSGMVVTSDEYGIIEFYTINPSADLTAGIVQVYENGGLDEA